MIFMEVQDVFKFKECRVAAGLSPKEVSIELDISVQAISHWEKGARFPSGEMLVKLCDLYGCTADQILGREPLLAEIKKDPPPPLGEGEREVVIPLDDLEKQAEGLEQLVAQLVEKELSRRGYE